MKPIAKRLFLSSILVIMCLHATASAYSSQAEHGPALAQMMLDDLQAINHVPGMAFAIRLDDGREYCVVTGYADLEQGKTVNCRTQFRLASVSKLFAVTAAAKLVSERQLDIDAPVGLYVPYLDLEQGVKVSQLLSHTSGLPHYRAPDGGKGLVHYTSVRAGWEAYGKQSLSFAPGTGYQYSTMGYTLLSAAIEGATGLDYLGYLQNKILAGLGTHEIAAEDPTNPHPEMSVSYAVNGDEVAQASYYDYSYSWAGAGMRSNVVDLAKFGAMYFDDKLLDQETKATFFTPARIENGETVGRYYYRTALGWRIGQDFKNRRMVHHAGVATGARSALVLYPDDQISIAILSNARWSSQIERTAYILALPFQTKQHLNNSESCPEMGDFYSGEFEGAIVNGHVDFRFENNTCILDLTVDNALGERLWRNHPGEIRKLRFYFVEENDNEVTLAMVSPYGLAEASFSSGDNQCRISGYIGNDRQYHIDFGIC